MQRLAAIILVIGFLLLGAGALEHLHNLDHARQDAALAQASHHPVKPAPCHDETNCPLHAQLHMPTVSVAWVPLLIVLGLLVAFLTMAAPPLTPQPALARLACRGPPRR